MHRHFSLNVKRNKVTRKREQAFYVDIRDNGSGAPSPFDITFDEAGEWLERADYAVGLAEDIGKRASDAIPGSKPFVQADALSF